MSNVAFSFERISVLEIDNWLEFEPRAKGWLIESDYENLLEGKGPKSRATNETKEDYESRIGLWEGRNARAFYGIHSKLGDHTYQLVKDKKNLKDM
ncbi:MAG: hypothetical protein MMC33_007416 [Icmadophila ericetorum]|nr:hypothetical protein [Icmadophila ericetorum]